jgi:hypothetical protein
VETAGTSIENVPDSQLSRHFQKSIAQSCRKAYSQGKEREGASNGPLLLLRNVLILALALEFVNVYE